jgi:hypothetical protein
MSRRIHAEGRSTALPAASSAARSSGESLILNGDGFLAVSVALVLLLLNYNVGLGQVYDLLDTI